jgi:HEAT repeat protein
VIGALGALKATEAVGALIDLLPDRRALWSLGSIGSREAIPPILRLLEGDSSLERQEAAGILGRLGAREAVPELTRLLQDEDHLVRRESALALSSFGIREVLPAIGAAIIEEYRTFIIDDWDQIDEETLHAFEALWTPESLDAVALRLEDRDAVVRRSILTALERVEATTALPRVARLLRDPDDRVRALAARVVAELRGRDYTGDIAGLLADPYPSVRAAAARSLGSMGSAPHRDPLRGLLSDAFDPVRGAAAEALADLGDHDSLPAIRRLLADEEKESRASAVRALGRFRKVEDLPSLIKALQDEEEQVQNEAAEALAALGAPEAIPALKAAASAGRGQLSAAQPLCLMGSIDGVTVILNHHPKLLLLNSVRRHEDWTELRKRRLEKDLQGSGKDVLEAFAALLGKRCVVEDEGVTWRPDWKSSFVRIPSRLGRMTLAEALVEINKGPYGAILERDHVRFVSAERAAIFWREWWKTAAPK